MLDCVRWPVGEGVSTEEIGSAAHGINGMARDHKETMQRFQV
ncbi:hypothetical protein [Methanoculleus sp.]